ncbi:uncharacterized protein TNCV_2452751 [Trichonephila clavipes]|nr:uncharacterized protein TNCV_2452751 [Trichonephila clavipes]
MPPDRLCQIELHEIHHGKGLDCTPVVTVAFEHHTVDNAIWLGPPNFEEKPPGGGEGLPNFLPLLPTSREDLRLDSYFEYPHAAKTLHIYKHPCLRRDSNPGPTAQQLSVTNHYIGCPAVRIIKTN